MSEFRVVLHEHVRLRDLDPRDHLNNAVFSVFAADAVLAWCGGDLPPDVRLVRMEIDFRSPVLWGEAVEVAVRVTAADDRGVAFAFEIRADGRLAAEGTRVLAGDDAWRERVAGHAGVSA